MSSDFRTIEKPMSDFKILTVKDVMNFNECSKNTAIKILKQIRQEYKIKKVLLVHYKLYYCIKL